MSPLRKAIVLAKAGYDVCWFSKVPAFRVLLDEMAHAGADVRRSPQRACGRWPSGGRIILKDVELTGCRGHSVDALFIPSSMMGSEHITILVPMLAGSGLVMPGGEAPIFSTSEGS